MVKKYFSMINGKAVEGTRIYYAMNPFDQSIIEENSFATKQIVEQAVASARSALWEWRNTSVNDRAAILKRAASLILSEQGEPGELIETEIVSLIISEMGKSIYEAEIEVFESSDMLNYFATEGVGYLSEIEPKLDQTLWPSKISKIVFEPIGVIGIIKPWNYPLEIPLWAIGAALLGGNTIVFKPSEITSGVGCYIEKIMRKAGLPSGVLNIVLGDREIGEYLVDSEIDMVSFTGGNAVGKTIYEKCSNKMIKCSLELGGKDAFIVCNDADLERASNGAVWGAFANAGQVCVAGERFYVQSGIYDKFLERVVSLTSKLKLGSGKDNYVDITPLASEKQFEKVKRLVSDAVEKGVKVLIGGKPIEGKGFFFEPTILEKITPEMHLTQEEIFGPVMPIYKFETLEDAISEVNDSIFGLGASVWSQDLKKAEIIAESLNVGMVWINDINVAFPQCPWGGVKQSGLGSDLSQFGIYEYTSVKHISIENSNLKMQPWWYPYKKG